MPRVAFTPHLSRFFPDLAEEEVEATTAAELVQALGARHPGLAAYLVDETGALRRHVNLFVDGAPVRDRAALTDPLPPDARVHVMQALSGG